MAKYNLDNLKFIQVRATLAEMELSEESVREAINRAIAQANKREGKEAVAEVGPIGPNDKPRMLQISAFIAHAGPANRNRQAFREADLQRVVSEGLFRAPYFGMIDYNHDFVARGAWYATEWAFDNEAGQYGILAHGAVWAWRYNDIAEEFLAQQARQGFVDVSMSCLYKASDLLHDANGDMYELIHDPIFLTTSLLDVPKGDVNARGLVSEDPSQSNEDRTTELLKASLANEAFNVEEDDMEELMKRIEAMFGEQKAELKPLMEALANLPQVEQKLREALAAHESAKARVTELEGQVATLTSEKAALTTAKETADVALAAAQKELETLTNEVTELRTFKSGIEDKEAKAAAEKRAEARKAEIPEAVTETLKGMENGEAILAKWMEQSDEEWAVTKAVFSVPEAARKTMAERSAQEGLLSGASEPAEGRFAIDKYRKNGK